MYYIFYRYYIIDIILYIYIYICVTYYSFIHYLYYILFLDICIYIYYYIILYYIVLYYIVLYYIILYYVILYNMILYYIISDYIISYFITIYYSRCIILCVCVTLQDGTCWPIYGFVLMVSLFLAFLYFLIYWLSDPFLSCPMQIIQLLRSQSIRQVVFGRCVIIPILKDLRIGLSDSPQDLFWSLENTLPRMIFLALPYRSIARISPRTTGQAS